MPQPTPQQQQQILDALVIQEETRRRKNAELLLQQAQERIEVLIAEVEKLTPKDKPKESKKKA